MLRIFPLTISQALGVHGTSACPFIALRMCAYFAHSNSPQQTHIEQCIRDGVSDWVRLGSPGEATMDAVHLIIPPARYDLVAAEEMFGVHLAPCVSVSVLPSTLTQDGLALTSLNAALDRIEQRLVDTPLDHGLAAALTYHGHTISVGAQRLANDTHCFHCVDGRKLCARDAITPDGESGNGVWVLCQTLSRLKQYLHELLPGATDAEQVRTQVGSMNEHMMYASADGKLAHPSCLFTLVLYTGRTDLLQRAPVQHSAIAQYVI